MIATRQELGRGQTRRWLLRLGGVASALMLSATLAHVGGCQATDGPPPGPPPVITAVKAGENGFVSARRTDAGAPLGCCTFSVAVNYNLDGADFIRHGTIEWDDARTSKTRFQFVPTNLNDDVLDASPGAAHSLELSVTLPGVLVDGSKDVRHGFVVRLYSGAGGVSEPVAGSITVR